MKYLRRVMGAAEALGLGCLGMGMMAYVGLNLMAFAGLAGVIVAVQRLAGEDER
jgi:hypothetical protein